MRQSTARAVTELSGLRTRVVALVGNPNTGKSTVFNALTGHRQRVGNYPGVTIERRTGLLRAGRHSSPVEIVDLPGAYSFAAHGADEAIVLDALLGRQRGVAEPDLVVVVIDCANLARNLFFATQVLEIGKPVVVALNMIDVAEAAGVRVDADALSGTLGIPVVPIVASRQTGIGALTKAIVASFDTPPSTHCTAFPDCVEAEVEGLTVSLAAGGNGAVHQALRAEALQTLLGPGGYHEERLTNRFGPGFVVELTERRKRIQAAGESVAEVEARVRYAWIDEVTRHVTTRVRPAHRSGSEAVDRVLTHRVLGPVILLAVMAVCFQAVFFCAAPLMDAIDGLFVALGTMFLRLLPEGALQSLIVHGVVDGVGTVLVFLPQILILFLLIAILEDCGYLSRTAVLLDRWMGLVGLNGKSFIPLLSSFACAVPGIMATRTIDNRRDRLATILIAPLMSCSARLPIYALLIAAFVPARAVLGGLMGLQALTLLGLYCVGVVVAIPVALIAKRTILRGEAQSFLMELPTYKWPSVRTVFFRVVEQGRAFCVSAGTIIFAMTLVVWALGYYPHPASVAVEHEAMRAAARQAHARQVEALASESDSPVAAKGLADSALAERLSDIDRRESGTYLRQSILGRMGRWIEPVVRPIGWDWRIGTAVIASFPAREIVVATMGTIFNLEGEGDRATTGLRAKLREATRPDGRPLFNVAVAFSIMVFYALCCQCGGTLATIKRETNSWRWPLLTFAYMTGLAYFGAWATYRIIITLT